MLLWVSQNNQREVSGVRLLFPNFQAIIELYPLNNILTFLHIPPERIQCQESGVIRLEAPERERITLVLRVSCSFQTSTANRYFLIEPFLFREGIFFCHETTVWSIKTPYCHVANSKKTKNKVFSCVWSSHLPSCTVNVKRGFCTSPQISLFAQVVSHFSTVHCSKIVPHRQPTPQYMCLPFVSDD